MYFLSKEGYGPTISDETSPVLGDAMSLSRRCAETLIDLVEIKLSCLEITDREDLREKELLMRCVQELNAELRGENGAMAAFAAPKRRGRRPKHLQFHDLHAA